MGRATILLGLLMGLSSASALAKDDAAPGQLTIVDRNGKVGALCPLKKTSVTASIAGFGARVQVVQTFTNPEKTPIEAVYTFPLPSDAAVDRMRMRIGDRVVEGEIRRREEALAIYQAAKAAGQMASLLDQERPNIFTQSVANIMPGAQVQIEISYVQLLKYEEGQFEFSFPMVVGPRFLGNAQDPGKIAPPVTPEGTRTGTNIDLSVSIDAGAPIVEMKSVLHQIAVQGGVGSPTASVKLSRLDEIPNRDFILRYRTATDSVQSAFLTHMDGAKGGFFQLVVLPPKAPRPQQIAPREIIFVTDQSGSQQGFPIEKSKELMRKLIKALRPGDTFNMMGFANQVTWLWPSSKPATETNLAEAEKFLVNLQANGGTQLLNAIQAAMHAFAPDTRRTPLIVFNTDGFVGDEANILKAIREQRGGARIFTFGIGNGCNRYLIDGMSEEGRGDAEYVTLREKADEAAARFIRRIDAPVLTDIQIRFEGVAVTQQLPVRIPDVFSEKPIMVCGRYAQPGKGTLVIEGNLGGQPWTKRVPVEFDARADASAIPTLWARRQVAELSRQEPYVASETDGQTARDAIIQVALDYGIMSQYTSFVAVEKKVVNIGGKQRTVRVPVEMTEGVSYEGVFGKATLQYTPASTGLFRGGAPGGMGGGGGFGGGRSGISAGGTVAKLERRADAGPGTQDPYETKVAKQLRAAKGPVEVQILVANTDPLSLRKLTDAGFAIAQTDKGLKVVFGKCDAKVLKALAKLDFVKLISPL